MNLDSIDHSALLLRLAGRASWRADPPDPSPALCPGCGAPLRIDPAGPDDPDRLVAACKARQCGEVVACRICERRFIVAGRRRR